MIRWCSLLLGLSMALVPAGDVAAQAASAAFEARAARRSAYRQPKVHEAVRAGITWLVEHQSEKGNWDADGFMARDPKGQECDGAGQARMDVGVTALALLALLAQADPLHAEATHRAAEWLADQQIARSGLFERAVTDFVYPQAIATLAMAEAAAMFGRERYLEVARKGVAMLASHRKPGMGWRYTPRDDSDTSVTSWCVAAYRAALEAGIEVAPEDVAEALAWLESVTNASNGHAGYTRRDEASARLAGEHSVRFPPELGEALTAAAMNTRTLVGVPPDTRLSAAGARLLLAKLPEWNVPAGKIDFYYWYHATEAVAALPLAAQRQWTRALHGALLRWQREDGAYSGSWDPVGVWSEHGGRVYSTAMCVLMLSSPYRSVHGDTADIVPDVPPFRRVHAYWRSGDLGKALNALARLDPAEVLPGQEPALRRLQWFARLHEHYGRQVAGRATTLLPNLEDRALRLADLRDRFAGHEVAQVVAAAIAALDADPAYAAQAALAEVLASFDPKRPPTSRGKRKALVDRLKKIVAEHPGTAAAEEAQRHIARLGG
ncbi:MAG: hypothetical protein KDE27_26570 [Planctomycetes bacterium]|nr:hypothetical protein [Planctomycetota bacterium]